MINLTLKTLLNRIIIDFRHKTLSTAVTSFAVSFLLKRLNSVLNGTELSKYITWVSMHSGRHGFFFFRQLLSLTPPVSEKVLLFPGVLFPLSELCDETLTNLLLTCCFAVVVFALVILFLVSFVCFRWL